MVPNCECESTDTAKPEPYVAGIDGCPGGWVAFVVDLSTRGTRVLRVELEPLIQHQPDGLAILAIDICRLASSTERGLVTLLLGRSLVFGVVAVSFPPLSLGDCLRPISARQPNQLCENRQEAHQTSLGDRAEDSGDR